MLLSGQKVYLVELNFSSKKETFLYEERDYLKKLISDNVCHSKIFLFSVLKIPFDQFMKNSYFQVCVTTLLCFFILSKSFFFREISGDRHSFGTLKNPPGIFSTHKFTSHHFSPRWGSREISGDGHSFGTLRNPPGIFSTHEFTPHHFSPRWGSREISGDGHLFGTLRNPLGIFSTHEITSHHFLLRWGSREISENVNFSLFSIIHN